MPEVTEVPHKKTKQNLEELLLYYQVELTRLEIDYLRKKLTSRYWVRSRSDATVDDTSSISPNISPQKDVQDA